MARYRKKPVEIEAVQWHGANVNLEEVGNFIGTQALWGINSNRIELFIRTLEGEMTASPGDWIIKGVAGEFYPCKPDIFDETYERVVG